MRGWCMIEHKKPAQRVTCPVCETSMSYVSNSILLSTYDVAYYRCPQCDLLRTEDPYWLEEAYSSAIASTDIGLLQRNFQISSLLAPVLYMHDKMGRYLDYAGGYGILCRLMRDIGFDFYTADEYCTNLFAQNFAWVPQQHTDLAGVTAMEVLEHVHNPLKFFANLAASLSESGIIVFSTLLYSGKTPGQDWWYYSFDTGQHISFFTEKTLRVLAAKLDMHLVSGESVHMLSRKPQNAWLFRRLTGKINFLATAYVRRRMASRLQDDYAQACAQLKGN